MVTHSRTNLRTECLVSSVYGWSCTGRWAKCVSIYRSMYSAKINIKRKIIPETYIVKCFISGEWFLTRKLRYVPKYPQPNTSG